MDDLEEFKAEVAEDANHGVQGMSDESGEFDADFDDEEQALEGRIAEALGESQPANPDEYFHDLLDLRTIATSVSRLVCHFCVPAFSEAVARVERDVQGEHLESEFDAGDENTPSTPDHLLWSFAAQIVDLRARCPASKSFVSQILRIFKVPGLQCSVRWKFGTMC